MSTVHSRIVLFTLAIGLLVSLPLLGHVARDPDFYGFKTDLPVPPLPGYETDEGELRLVFFGYRHCGTVCPLQLGNLQALHERLAHKPVRFVFVTLDPQRDSKQALDRMMAAMGGKFKAVRPPTMAAAQTLAMGYSEYAGKTDSGDNYDFDHSARIYVVTPDDRRQLLYATPELDLNRVQSDINTLLAQTGRKDASD